MLVRVLRDVQPEDGITRGKGSPTIAALPAAALRERMTKFASFKREKRQGDNIIQSPAHPTVWLVNAVHVRYDWPGIRYLSGISEVPILRPDGTIWQERGYDCQTGVLYEPPGRFPPIPDTTHLDDARAALETLLEVVCDFRFESDDHRAAWLAGLLTPFARFAFDGPPPLFLIDANVPGAGKGLLAQTIGQIVLGKEMPVSSYAHDTEEMRKTITAIALAGDRLVLLDNLDGKFGNGALDRALTSTRWKDRVLGTNQQVDLPLFAVWYGTGNNVMVGDDTSRRIIHIRLDVLDEHPEERTGFRHSDLIGWIRTRRPHLAAAALTILSAFIRAGQTDSNLPPFGSFEGWSQVVRQAVVWIGLPDPCRTRTRLAKTSNSTAENLARLMKACHQFDPNDEGIVAAELVGKLYPVRDHLPMDEASVALRGALEGFVGCSPGKAPSARQIGNKLKSHRRRVLDGLYFDTNPEEHHRNGAVWRLYRCQEGD
jgi:hypothetical protein